jgi:uncharacterized protein (DUF58 family)
MWNIFIKRWVFLFTVIVSSLVIGLRTEIGFFYFFFWLLLSIVLISFFWVGVEYASAELTLIRKVPAKIEEEDTLSVEAEVVNKSILPFFNLVLEDCLPCARPAQMHSRLLVEYLGRGGVSRLSYACFCPQRGSYKIGPLAVYFFDPFGILFLKKTYPVYSQLYVTPKTFRITRFPLLSKGVLPWFGIEAQKSSGDENEFYGVREYKEGDPIKAIHWFSTARKNMLIVKQFQRQTFYRASIIFDLEEKSNFGKGKESVAEYTIRLAASTAQYLINMDVSVEVFACAQELVHLPFNKGKEHLEDILRFLSVAQPKSKVSFSEMFEEFTRFARDSTLILIMSDKEWSYLPALLPLEKRNISLVPLVLLSASFLYPDKKEKALLGATARLSRVFKFNPILFSRGDNIAEVFLE